jgi:hypothetical protein
MTNQIAVNWNGLPNLISKMKLGTHEKTKIYNETKTVTGQTMKFAMSDPRLAASLPAHQKNSLFIVSR